MPTSRNPLIILGGGIIGTSTAYFASLLNPNREIHIVEAAPSLFPSASSRGAGFLAKDWFSSSVADLGNLSFKLHKKLAEQHNGTEKWGYSGSIGISLINPTAITSFDGEDADRGESWLFQGSSRAEAAMSTSAGTMTPAEPADGIRHEIPSWLNVSTQVEVISHPDSTAQIDPHKFCNFLMGECIARGVHLHLSTTATSVLVHPETSVLAGIQTSTGLILPCSQILITSGVWTPRVIETLFPNVNPDLPVLSVTSLAGHSIVYRTSDPSSTKSLSTSPSTSPSTPPICHAVFTTDKSANFSPELFSRLPHHEIFLAGLNSSTIPIPLVATPENSTPPLDDPSIIRLNQVGESLIRPTLPRDKLHIVRTGLCHRPVLPDGKPIMGRIPDSELGFSSGGGSRRSSNSSDISGRSGGGGETSPTSVAGRRGSSSEDGGSRGVYTCVGHGPWGIALSTGSGLVMAEMLEGRKTSADVGLLSVEHAISLR